MYHYKRYLTGYSLTLHRTMFEFRELKSNSLCSTELIDYIFKSIEDKMLSLEFYEYMPRFIKSKKSILKKLSL